MRVNCSKVLGSLAAGLFFISAGALAAEPPKEMKLYVFSSGALNLDKSIIQNGSSGKVQIPVGFFLIRHPKGDVLFDCGNNDKIITNPDYWGPFVKALDPGRSPDIAIDAQLSKINVKPSDIKYVVLGHFHVDHAGNIGKFLDSTFVFQRDEIRNAFWPAPGYATFFITDDFSMLRNSVGGGMPSKYKSIELDGDLDLFGDNSVYIHRSVSHTPGSQILVVRLPKTGTVVLTSDAVYLQENLDKNILPSIGSVYDPVGHARRLRLGEAGPRRRGRRHHLRARSRYVQGAQALARILRVIARSRRLAWGWRSRASCPGSGSMTHPVRFPPIFGFCEF